MAGLSPERIRSVLDYDPLSGELRWKARASPQSRFGVRIGEIAGTVTAKGYRLIMIDRERHPAHRLVWMMVHGRLPTRHIDHVNGMKDDNRLCNLREASDSENKANGPVYKNNQCGLKGAYWERNRGWRAQIRKNKKLVHLGYFATAEEAHAAYCAAAPVYHGAFARAA